MSLVAVVDYNMGNLRSVAQALEHVSGDQAKIQITSDPTVIADADRVVFPGQGAARDCMREIENRSIVDAIKQAATEKPFLGVCMGMQVLLDHSEENDGVDCLGVFKGEVKSFRNVINTDEQSERLKIPQMGWNQIKHTQDHPLWAGIDDNSRFYFVHSYYIEPDDSELMAGSTDYGITYASAIARDNIFAMQSHPEKSADDGLRLLKNFIQWDGKP